MKKSILFFMLLHSIVWAQFPAIVQGEYYFDSQDPGFGQATVIAVANPSNSLVMDFEVPTAGLSPGFHYLNVRVRTDSTWSTVLRKKFLVKQDSASFLAEGKIDFLEYYFDGQDPGFGKATPAGASLLTDILIWEDSLNTDMLPPGFHWISFRGQYENGTWSPTWQKKFYKRDSTKSDRLSLIEYVIGRRDTNFITGMVPIMPSQYKLETNFEVGVDSLAPGIYDFCISVQTEEKVNSGTTCRQFQVIGRPTSVEEVTEASINVYPNPSSGLFFIETHDYQLVSYQISDMQGKIVQQRTLPTDTRLHEID
ncbi:MAG: T9SS type A sorting domain-containing protein, partial [Bacteroidota bacterium]